jgi:rare lipoprotein A
MISKVILGITSWMGSLLFFDESFILNSATPTNINQLPGGVISQILKTSPIAQWQKFLQFEKINYFSPKQLNPFPIHSFQGLTTDSKSGLCANIPKMLIAQPGLKIVAGLIPLTLNQSKIKPQTLCQPQFLQSLQGVLNQINPPIVATSTSNGSLLLIFHRQHQNYQIWLNNQLFTSLPDETTATNIHKNLQQLLQVSKLDPRKLQPGLVGNSPAIMLGDRPLLIIEPEIANQLNINNELLAIDWANNLRLAFNQQPLTLSQGQMAMYGVKPSPTKLNGFASWYGDGFHGKLTANGEIYNQYELTVAHRSLPFNTYLKVKNLLNGKTVIVRVNDRGPYISPRSLDLSMAAARVLDGETTGVIPYEALVLQPTHPQITLNQPTLSPQPGLTTKNPTPVLDYN